MTCGICCPLCQSKTLPILGSSTDPYSVNHLLPAGTVTITVSREGFSCDHEHVDEGWHRFHGTALIPLLANDAVADKRLCYQLDFLISHKFLSVHCRLGTLRPILYLRIYIIPYDLANVQGRLRVRDETSILKHARQYIKNLLPRIVQNVGQWHANDEVAFSTPRVHFFHLGPDKRTLADIYGDLPSPVVNAKSLNEPPTGNQNLVQIIAHTGLQINGLKSRLHHYQRESVATMLDKETCPARTLDPLYIPIIGIDKKTFFLQPATMEILKECPIVVPARGGILCEDMGTGKTIMILSLVLATIDQLPAPEESFSDPRPIMTPVAFRHFPHPEFASARENALRGCEAHRDARFPTLVEMMLHYLRTHQEDLDLRHSEHQQYLEDRGLSKLLGLNVPFYLHYEELNQPATRGRCKPVEPAPRVIYLTPATLVVVPPNLLAQWTSEIHKHCESDLRFLVVKSKDKFPRAQVLATDYDIILTNHARFAAEESRFDLAALRTWSFCSCPGYDKTRIPNCTCMPNDVSPLAQMRWKRLVIDEGHVSGTDRTRISNVASMLNVERRWIVSGTPTRHLLGLKFGSQAENVEDAPKQLVYPEGCGELDREETPSVASSDGGMVRPWTRQDREDLHRLETMICHFLRDPRFSSQSDLFDVNVIRQLCAPDGPEPGATQVLIQVMGAMMVRHRTKDIELDVVLPPMTHEVVLLDLDPIVLKSYNALQAVIAVNAVDSERRDKDYLFHPSSVASLRALVENMSQLMFWHVDEKRYNVEELSRGIDSMIATAEKRNRAASDLILLRESKRHIQLAARDVAWNALQTYFDPVMPFEISNIPMPIFTAWKQLSVPARPAAESDSCEGILFPDHLILLRHYVSRRPLSSMQQLVEEGHRQASVDQVRKELSERQSRVGKEKGNSKKGHHGEKNGREASKATESARKADAPETMMEVQRELETLSQTDEEHRAQGEQLKVPDSTASAARRQFLLNSPLTGTRIQYSRSSKLNFMLSEVLRYGATEKFLIFSKSPLTLMHVAEGLNIIRVKHLQYTTETKLERREQFVLTFETSETFRVLLMELKHGSHGLNLTSASRVIFCEPVWQADTEAQAIKRAHRIGQKRPISVKVLAIRGTPEEIMTSRRAEQRDDNSKLPTDLTDDVRMRDFIANPKFIEQESYTPIKLDVPLLDIPAEPCPPSSAPIDPSSPVQRSVELGGPDQIDAPSPRTILPRSSPPPDERPAKKRRLVMFAECM